MCYEVQYYTQPFFFIIMREGNEISKVANKALDNIYIYNQNLISRNMRFQTRQFYGMKKGDAEKNKWCPENSMVKYFLDTGDI